MKTKADAEEDIQIQKNSSSGRVVANSVTTSPSSPPISLPKGGGAIKGIGEKFVSNPFNGTCSLIVPIFTSPSRSDFYPKLALSYDSAGIGNGPFGLGWNLSIPSISRKTEKGLPRYYDTLEDSGSELSDTFILSGVEDLVPSLVQSDSDHLTWTKDIKDSPDGKYTVQRYRPRIEGLFALIEKWRNKSSPQDVFWRTISKDNIISVYGKSSKCRISNPDYSSHVFKWLLEESSDDKGNIIIYEYKQENQDNIDRKLPQEKNRLSKNKSYANKYLKAIKYGNRYPNKRSDWLFEVIFDYGEHDITKHDTAILETTKWRNRPDAFSNFRAGFEIRTQRLCRRVLMFHHFEELGDNPYLVRSTDFEYSTDHDSIEKEKVTTSISFLRSVTHTGYILVTKEGEIEKSYQMKSTPPLEFTYTKPKMDEGVHFIDPESLENLPIGVDGASSKWLDLNSEGISGILSEQSDAWFYKRNLGNAKFAPIQLVVQKPLLSDSKNSSSAAHYDYGISINNNNNNNKSEIMDLAGDGRKYLVQFNGMLKGFYKLSQQVGEKNDEWEPFTTFTSLPNINWNDPNLRFIDLDGDGLADILISEDDLFSWYPSKETEGFGMAAFERKPFDEEKGPAILFSDSTQSIYLADMTGDGLTDIVRIRNGEICYWPNMGYGRFGNKVTMANAPIFDYPDQFRQSNIRLSDIDGSGTTDIIYLDRDGIRFWFNKSGNSWSDTKHRLASFPMTDNLSSVMVVDLLGNGTSCIIWSSPLLSSSTEEGGHVMQYLDLMGGVKPHLLSSIKSNMGSETRLQYAASTKFYLEDMAEGKPWITKLPFPVHVVERIETYDYPTNTKLVSLFKYHHGYYDRTDREYRGFGFVEQWETESFDQFHMSGLFSAQETNGSLIAGEIEQKDEGLHVPPIHTKTWFHTGAYIEEKYISRHFAEKEYFKERDDPTANLLADSPLPDGLLFEERIEACRALKGQILRQEAYAEDDTGQSVYPYSVIDHNYQLELIQPLKDDMLHVAFYPHECETISFHYERNPNDPRVQHQLVLDVDKYGNVTRQAIIYYPRRSKTIVAEEIHPEQSQFRAVVNLSDYTEKIYFAKLAEERDIWITGQPYQSKSLEINGLDLLKDKLHKGRRYFHFSEIHDAIKEMLERERTLDYGENFDDTGTTVTSTALQARTFHWERKYYWDDSQDGILDLGNISSPALLHHNETAILPVSYFEGPNPVYDNTVITDKVIQNEGGYRKDVGYWWDKGVIQYYLAKEAFYLAHITVDQFGSFDSATRAGSYSELEYDKKYYLNPVKFIDPLKNVVSADIDYRVLKPKHLVDVNDNVFQVYFDELGAVVASTIFGHEEDTPKGDGNLYDPISGSEFKLLSDTSLKNVITDPQKYIQNASSFFFYDYLSWQNDGIPLHTLSVNREIHISDQKPSEKSQFQFAISYIDGLGRELQKKLKVDEGLAWVKQSDGSYKEQSSDERWLTSGSTVYNNKGKPIKQYEPFYSASREYESEKSLTEFGVTPIIHYDPLERVIRTETPKGFFSSVTFDPWKEEHKDENDNVKESRFYDELLNHDEHPTSWTKERLDAEKKALHNTESHANTPKILHMNNLAQLFLEEDSVDGKTLFTYHELDINGNKLSIIDPRQYEKNKSRSAEKWVKNFRFSYDMLNRQLQSISTDAGITKVFQDSLNASVHSWTARNFIINTKYDALHRPILIIVKGGDGHDSLDNIVEKIQYGESNPETKKKNKCGRPIIHCDQAGIREFLLYDIKGQNIFSQTKLRVDYKQEVDWNKDHHEELLELDEHGLPISYVSETLFDALNRLVFKKQSDNSIHQYKYHKSGQLKSVQVQLSKPSDTLQAYVKDIQYNAKGQRISIQYGNNTATTYEYEKETFRLESLKTHRSSDTSDRLLQDISYVYDPVGNITYIKDNSHRTVFRNQSKIEPVSTYEYDSLYRLTRADGRQHPAATAADHKDPTAFKQSHYLLLDSISINDSTALENYHEEYSYDLAGNLEKIRHVVPPPASSHSWTRTQTFTDDSNKIQSSKASNSLDYPADFYSFDEAGNMSRLENISEIRWNYRNNISSAILVGHEEDPSKNRTEYYVYRSDGTRVKKVMERYRKVAGILKFLDIEQKTYLDGYEIKQIKSINLETKESIISLERYSCHVSDSRKLITIIHRWNIDTKNIETDDLTETRVHYQLSNHLGSCSLELNDEELVISYEEYYPYGGTSLIADRSPMSSLSKEVSLKEYRYTGKERDDSTGLYYYGARYYAPWLVRWISCDPAELIDGSNLYIYVGCNPIRLSDPSGTQALDPSELPWSARSTPQERLRDPAKDPNVAWYTTREGKSAIAPSHDSPNVEVKADLMWLVRDLQHAPPSTSEVARQAAMEPWFPIPSLGDIKKAWTKGSTSDKIEIASGGVGAASVAVPVVGDFVAAGASLVSLGAKPSWSNLVYFGLDVVGAAIPLLPALGSARRAEKLSEAARLTRDAERASNAAIDAHFVYQLVDSEGEVIRYGITNNPGERLRNYVKASSQDYFKSQIAGMQVISDPLSLPQALSLETHLIRQAEAEGRLIYNTEKNTLFGLKGRFDAMMGYFSTPKTIIPDRTLLRPDYFNLQVPF